MVEIIHKILKVFQDNNLFEEGVELIGSWCFQLYQKHFGVKQFPLRTQDIDFLIPVPFAGKEHLLDNSIMIVDNGIKIRLPNPANFCLHKLIIVSRRRKFDKGIKDLEQAIHTFAIVDSKELQKLFNSLRRKWKQTIIRMFDRAKSELPLLGNEIEKLSLTLQPLVNK